MGDVILVLVVAAITFASRLSYLWRRPAGAQVASGFLELFPVALFVSLATVGLAAPHGDVVLGPGAAAAVGGVVGAVMGRRSILWTLVGGAAAFYLARAL